MKFANAEDLIEKMDIKMDYYDVSNEMLYEDNEFKNLLKRIKNLNGAVDEVKIR